MSSLRLQHQAVKDWHDASLRKHMPYISDLLRGRPSLLLTPDEVREVLVMRQHFSFTT